MKKSELKQLIREVLNEENKGDKEISSLKIQASKLNKKDSRYKEIMKKIYDLETDKEYGLPGSKASEKFKIKPTIITKR